MIDRLFWLDRIHRAWLEAPIVWLSGVRRAGKTTLARSLGDDQIQYLNCDLPSTQDLLSDPETFYKECRKPVVVFDEIHQLQDPAQVLKIGADAFPNQKILATGSSTLAASKKFGDTLAGRKRVVELRPVLWEELSAFGSNIAKRLFHGGLPPALLSEAKPNSFYREWMDSFFARDIQKLFGFRDFNRFNMFLEYTLKQSGGQFEVNKASTALGISRPTIESHLAALQITHAVKLVRPFFGGGSRELTKQPKLYGFDTGFVSWAKGWDPLRPDDLDLLWKHVVLEHLTAHFPDDSIHYRREYNGSELDFILPRQRERVDAIECRWNPDDFDASSLRAFRESYPEGDNYLVTPFAEPARTKKFGDMAVRLCSPSAIV